METIYTGACSAALNGNGGVPAVSFWMPCVSSQLLLLFLFFLFPFPPPFLPFQGSSGIRYTSVGGSFAICEQLSSFTLLRPLYVNFTNIYFIFWLGGETTLLQVISTSTPFPLVVHEQILLYAKNKRAGHAEPCFTTMLKICSLSHV